MSLPRRKFTPQEYLQIERQSSYRSEYLDGEIFQMSGASRRHNLVSGNVAGELRNQFKGRPCEVYQSDMRVKVKKTGLYTYPDVVAVCGQPQFDDEHEDTLVNPTVVVEVLSRTTEGYDREAKALHYRSVPSVSDYVLIAQNVVRVEHYARQSDGRWLYSEKTDLTDVLDLAAVRCQLSLSDIYDKVQLPAPA